MHSVLNSFMYPLSVPQYVYIYISFVPNDSEREDDD